MLLHLHTICETFIRINPELLVELRIFLSTHQVAKVAQRVPGQLHDALREAPVGADEAGEDRGQTVACSVQHGSNVGGGSPYCCLGAAAPCNATGKE